MFKKILSLFFVFMTLLFLGSCNKTNSSSAFTELRNPEKLSHNFTYEDLQDENFILFKNKIKDFSDKLSVSLAKFQATNEANTVCSPLSIELCLGLAVASSDGNTRKEILDAFGVDFDTFNEYYKLLYNSLIFEVFDNNNSLKSALSLTNSIWIDKNISLKDSGLDLLKNNYYCYSYNVDFKNKTAQSCEAIQKFIKEKTYGLLNPTLDLSPDTLFVLMNTLYLKDAWNECGFELEYADSKYKFTNKDGNESTNKLLTSSYEHGQIMKSSNFTAFHTDSYNGFTLFFIKPNDGYNVFDVFNKENISTVTMLNNYVRSNEEKQERYYTNCIFPEYSVECNMDIKDNLIQEFKINVLFDENECSFKTLTDTDCYAPSINHIARLEVNKKGIVGAAVTYIPSEATSTYDLYKDIYETFVVDKEFGYVLTYNGVSLFSGVITDIG